MCHVVIEDSYQRNARLGCCVWATSRDLAGHPARVFATTSPNVLRWMATFCPILTLSFSLTRSSTNPPWVARTVCPLLAMKMFVSFPVRPIAPAIIRGA